MGTIPSYDLATTPLQDSDQFYLERGVSADRGKRLNLGALAAYMSTAARAVYLVAGTGAQAFDTDDKASGIVVVSDTVTGLEIQGTAPTLKSQYLIMNSTPDPVSVTSTSGFLILGGVAVSSVILQYPGDALSVARVDDSPAIWAGQYITGSGGPEAISTVEEYTTGVSPEFNWSSSGTELTTGSLELDPGTWILEATVLVRGQSGAGALLNAESRWQDVYSSAPALVGAAGTVNATASVGLCSVTMPRRKVIVAAPTTYSLLTTAKYSGGSGNADAWVSITAHRIK